MKRALTITLFLFLTVVVLFAALNVYVSSFGRYSTDSLEMVVPEHAALLLGTAKWRVSGGENPYYRNRIDAAALLYHAGKVKKIVVSGANRTIHYNEPRKMKLDLVARGVPAEDIVCDYAGLRTLDSVVRFKEVFGQDRGIVISQPFHTARAIYIGRHRGVELFGYNARPVPLVYSFKTRLREILAKAVSVFDVEIFGTAPRHLGPAIDIDLPPSQPPAEEGEGEQNGC